MGISRQTAAVSLPIGSYTADPESPGDPDAVPRAVHGGDPSYSVGHAMGASRHLRTSVGRRVVSAVLVVAFMGCVSACTSTPGGSTQAQRVGAGTVGSPTTSVATPSASTTTASTDVPPAPTRKPRSGTTPSRSGAPGSTSTTVAPATTSTSWAPPDVVGQSLAAAEQTLQAAGYSAAAHPWGGSCTTQNEIMQQVPPSGGEVQLYYCPAS
jgi:hypothetical protein